MAANSPLKTYLEQLKGESNRGAAVLAASLIEEQLGLLLRTALREHKITNELLSNGGPLGGLHRRTRMAFAMNLISDQERKDCEYVGRVRNQFAHKLAASFLDSTGLQKAVRDHSSRNVADLEMRFSTADQELIAEVTLMGIVLADELARRISDRHNSESITAERVNT